MSIRIMSHVWEHSRQEGSALLLLLAIADFADDDGYAFPSVKRLATKARLSERAVQYALKDLEATGELSIERGGGRGNANRYRVHTMRHIEPITMQEVHPIKEETPQPVRPNKAKKVQKPVERVQPVAPEPSYRTVTKTATAAEGISPPMSEIEAEIARRIQAVPGMAMVPSEEIIARVREVNSDRASPVSERALLSDAGRFRDHWREERRSQPHTKQWRMWRKSVGSWFERTKELSDGREATSGTSGSLGSGTAARNGHHGQPAEDYDAIVGLKRSG